ncbi:nuclease [Butyrivibrio sp. XPD2006]|uniref:nuclease n=1 Tax=Butyrivibrio sp. XPD2006 TaxID=1280668 RepID=UPI0003B4AE18|nr:nuclease [Butyrivibrio sp. XPD2006]
MKAWSIVQWALAGFIALFAIVAFATSGGILSGLLFLALAVVISPLRKKIFALLPEKFQGRLIAIATGVVLAIASFATFPSTQTEVIEDDTEEVVEERFVDLEEKADEVVSVSQDGNNIIALSFSDDNDIDIVEGNEVTTYSVKAEVRDMSLFSVKEIKFISSNSKIATIGFAGITEEGNLSINVKGINPGETEVYAVTNDGSVESEHKKVTVKADEARIAKEKEAAEKAEAEKKAVEEAERKANEEKLAKEKETAEESAKKDAEMKATDVASSTQVEVAPVNNQEPSTSTGSGVESGGGNADNFNTYNNTSQQNTTEYVLNTSSKKFHYASCSSVPKISPENYATATNRDDILAQGYQPCKKCNP